MVRCVFSAEAFSGSTSPANEEPSQASRCALVDEEPDSPKLAGLGIGRVSGAPASISGSP